MAMDGPSKHSARIVSDCPTHLLDDAPAEQDSFGPHAGVAHAIASMIQSERGGRSIGLSGSWGAGKSTVIKLLEARLAQIPDTKLWLFDAWAHRGDPLRRTFLEKLISYLAALNWISVPSWTARSAELAGRRKIAEQTTTSRLSGFARTLAIAVVLVPMGPVLLGDGLKKGVTFSIHTGPPNLLAIFGVLLTIAPIVVGVAVSVFLELRHIWRRLWKQESRRPDYAQVFRLFVQKAEVETRTETTESPEPTSVEFERLFRELMQEALKPRSRRLVLVVDNLDRVEASEALTIWSTLQTFLQHGSHDSLWLDRVWVVLPYDETSIRLLWSGASSPARNLSASFLDKTFQVRFDVPPPSTSDWRGYLLGALQIALPKHTADEFQSIYRLVAVSLKAPLRAPTPRELKLIVNQIGAIHRQRGDEISLVHVAYYVLLCRLDRQVIPELLDGKLPDETVAGLVGDGIKDSLAALALGVEPRRARQLLLEGPIIAALESADSDALKGLTAASDGFPEVLEQAVERASTEWPKAEGGKLLHAVVALAESGLLDAGAQLRADRLLRALGFGAERISRLLPLTEAAERGMVMLCERTGNVVLATHLFSSYAESIAATSVDDPRTFSPQRVLGLTQRLEALGMSAAFVGGLAVPGGVDQYLGVIRDLLKSTGTASRSHWKVFRPQATPEAVAQTIAKAFEGGHITPEHTLAIQLLRQRTPEPPWDLVSRSTITRLAPQNNAPAAETTMLLDALFSLRDKPVANTGLKELLSTGLIAHHLAVAGSQSDAGALARCVYVSGMFLPAFAQPNAHVGHSPTGANQLQQYLASPPSDLPVALGNLLMSLDDRQWLFTALGSNPASRPLIGKTIGALSKLSGASNLFSPQDVIAQWPLFAEHAEIRSLVPDLGKNGALSVELIKRPLDRTQLELVEVLVSMGEADQPLLDWATKELQAVRRDEWERELRSNGPLLRLSVACNGMGKPLELGGPYREALESLAEDLASGVDVGALGWAVQRQQVFALLDSANRNVLRADLTKTLERHVRDVMQPFFDLFAEEIADSGRLKSHSTFATSVMAPLLGRRDAPGLRWIADLLEAHPDLLSKATPDNKQAFERDLAVALRDGADDESQAILRRIGTALNVRPARPSDPDVAG